MLLAKTPDIFEIKVFENKLQNLDSTFNISLFLFKVKVPLGHVPSSPAPLKGQESSHKQLGLCPESPGRRLRF